MSAAEQAPDAPPADASPADASRADGPSSVEPRGSGGGAGAHDGESTGLLAAWVMLGLMLVEWLVLLEVVAYDVGTAYEGAKASPFMVLYFRVVSVTATLQLVGIVCVHTGRLRLGGALQVAACAVHAIKVEGLLGIYGGMQALAAGRERARTSA